MTTSTATQMQSPRIENGRQMLIAGLGGRYNNQTMHTIPQLWDRFGPDIGRVPNQSGKIAYGVSYNPQPDHSTFDYLAGVEVTKFTGLPADFVQLTIPALKYAIFLTMTTSPRSAKPSRKCGSPGSPHPDMYPPSLPDVPPLSSSDTTNPSTRLPALAPLNSVFPSRIDRCPRQAAIGIAVPDGPLSACLHCDFCISKTRRSQDFVEYGKTRTVLEAYEHKLEIPR